MWKIEKTVLETIVNTNNLARGRTGQIITRNKLLCNTSSFFFTSHVAKDCYCRGHLLGVFLPSGNHT